MQGSVVKVAPFNRLAVKSAVYTAASSSAAGFLLFLLECLEASGASRPFLLLGVLPRALAMFWRIPMAQQTLTVIAWSFSFPITRVGSQASLLAITGCAASRSLETGIANTLPC
ncbi:hypothetical protein E2C01_077929 [Portunus trituberculatus]|uniref:Uncharacterized protein n=1 Tax=Portunus trituberculatus TaxID=210409 RepID=A0A5B7ISR7_PORTR|nr:hypothetical protein [Portunus trituberculatus]